MAAEMGAHGVACLAARRSRSRGCSSPLAAAAAPAAPTPAPEAPAGGGLVPFMDNDYEVKVPSDFTYFETAVPYVERGPQPERSPVRARFESRDGRETISIVMRNAQTIKPTLFQIADITQYGTQLEAAQLLLPRGSTLLTTSQVQVAVPPKTTPLGAVALPPRTVYRYEFTTPTGLHVAMAVAAQRGRVYVCGASTTQERWAEASQRLMGTAASFRLRDGATPLG